MIVQFMLVVSVSDILKIYINNAITVVSFEITEFRMIRVHRCDFFFKLNKIYSFLFKFNS